MFSIIIRKRFLYLLLAILIGTGLLFSGLLEIPAKILKKERTVAVQNTGLQPAPRPASPVAPGNRGEITVSPTQAKTQLTISERNDLDFFIEYRLDRERTRGRQIELLREIINSPTASEQARQKVQEELLAISGKLAKEMELEHLIRAKGYQDATVCIEEKGVTVVVQPAKGQTPQKITPEDITKICEVVSWGTGVGEQNIVVIPKT